MEQNNETIDDDLKMFEAEHFECAYCGRVLRSAFHKEVHEPTCWKREEKPQEESK